jgi:hypothetical protein
VPLAGHGLRPTPLRRRAGRPQLKRDPLGSTHLVIETAARFTWTSLTLSWLAERADTTLLAAAALRRAREELESRGAAVELASEGDRLCFGGGWRAGRSWLSLISGGAVQVERDAERILVTAQASLWPLVLWSLPVAVVLVATGFHALLLLALLLFLGGHSVAAYNGLRDVARAALTLSPPERAA